MRYLLYPFIINYLHIYFIAPYLMYISYNSITIKDTLGLNIHYKILMSFAIFSAIYHLVVLWDRSIAIVGFIFLFIAVIEYFVLFKFYFSSETPDKISKFNLV